MMVDGTRSSTLAGDECPPPTTLRPPAQVMLAVGVTTALGLPVTGVHLNPEPRRFAFVEFRSVHEASNALAFDGVTCQGEPLRVQRPHDYNAAAAVALGPSLPPPALTPALLSAVGALVDETAAPRVSVLGLPPSWAEDRVNALLGRFGALRGLSLVRGPDGAPSGAALAEYIDPGALPAVLASASVPARPCNTPVHMSACARAPVHAPPPPSRVWS